MKRKIAVVLLLVMLLMLTACQQAPKGTTWQPITKNGEVMSLSINFDDHTITASEGMHSAAAVGSDGEMLTPADADVYHYTYGEGDITITYPNGATWWENASNGGAVSGWDGDYDTDRYIDGMVLAQQLNQAYQYAGKDWDHVVVIGILCLVIIILGIFMIKDPETVIHMKYGLRFYHVEPTEFTLWEVRIGGIVGIAGSVILFLVVALD